MGRGMCIPPTSPSGRRPATLPNTRDPSTRIDNTIAYWRKRRPGKHGCLSQRELAGLIDRSPAAVGRYEQGKRLPTVPVLFKLAEALQMPPASLYPELFQACVLEVQGRKHE